MKRLEINQNNLRTQYANKRRQSVFKGTKRVAWKSKSRFIA